MTRVQVKSMAGISGSRNVLLALCVALSVHACAPRRVYRPPLAAPPSPSQLSPSPSTAQPAEPKPTLEQARIKEEDLKEKRTPSKPALRDQRETTPAPREEAPSLPEESLIAKITPRTPPQRAASLRLTEEGRRLLESRDYAKALARLEKTIAIDSTNPYGYYFLAKAHHHLSRYQESLNFLDIAESLLGGEPYWLAEVFALRGENYRALGSIEKADSSYSQALRINPGNRLAADGLNMMGGGK